MEPFSLALQATVMRRQLALLAHETLTTERRLVMEAVLRLSYDCARLEAPLPSQARLARITGLNKGDVCRAEKSLEDMGLLRVRFGLDGWRLYEPQPDAQEWAGVRWRIPDAAERRAAIDEELWLASGEGPGAPEQARLPLSIEPTPGQEYDAALGEARRENARRAAGAEADGVPSFGPAAAIPPGEPCLGAGPAPGKRDWAALKAQIKGGYPPPSPPHEVGQAANEEPAALARQPTSRWPGSQPADPEIGRRWPGGQRGVGRAANAEAPTLAARPTPASQGCLPGRPRVQSHLPSPISASSPKPSPISFSASAGEMETGDVAGAAREDGQMADAELWTQIAAVIGGFQAREWGRWWRRELRPAGRKLAAREALGDLKIRQDLARSEAGEPIEEPGKWFVGRFCLLAGIARKGGGGGSRP